MAKRFIGTFFGTPIIRDPEADIAKAKKLVASMNKQELARWLKKRGELDIVFMLENGEAATSSPYPGRYYPYDSDGLPDLGKLVDIEGNPVPFPRKERRRRRKMSK